MHSTHHAAGQGMESCLHSWECLGILYRYRSASLLVWNYMEQNSQATGRTQMPHHLISCNHSPSAVPWPRKAWRSRGITRRARRMSSLRKILFLRLSCLRFTASPAVFKWLGQSPCSSCPTSIITELVISLQKGNNAFVSILRNISSVIKINRNFQKGHFVLWMC